MFYEGERLVKPGPRTRSETQRQVCSKSANHDTVCADRFPLEEVASAEACKGHVPLRGIGHTFKSSKPCSARSRAGAAKMKVMRGQRIKRSRRRCQMKKKVKRINSCLQEISPCPRTSINEGDLLKTRHYFSSCHSCEDIILPEDGAGICCSVAVDSLKIVGDDADSIDGCSMVDAEGNIVFVKLPREEALKGQGHNVDSDTHAMQKILTTKGSTTRSSTRTGQSREYCTLGAQPSRGGHGVHEVHMPDGTDTAWNNVQNCMRRCESKAKLASILILCCCEVSLVQKNSSIGKQWAGRAIRLTMASERQQYGPRLL
jgi:hypothetical protein